MIREALLALVCFLSLASASMAQVRVDDMIFDRDPFVAQPAGPTGASGFSGWDVPWTGNLIPVEFPANATAEQRAQFFRVCGEWTKYAAIGCVPHSGQAARALITTLPGACYSNIGAPAGGVGIRVVNLDLTCWDDRTIAHEIGHLIGLVHEHQRPDRDTYLNVNPACNSNAYGIIPGASMITGYDFTSIMHYPLSTCIALKPAYAGWGPALYAGYIPSATDGATAAAIYGAPIPSIYPTPIGLTLTGVHSTLPWMGISWSRPANATQFNIDLSSTPTFTDSLTTTIFGPDGQTGVNYGMFGELWPGQVYVRVTGVWTALGLSVSSSNVISAVLPGAWTRPALFRPGVIGNEVRFGWAGKPEAHYLVFRTTPGGAPVAVHYAGIGNVHVMNVTPGTWYVSIYSTTLPESAQITLVMP